MKKFPKPHHRSRYRRSEKAGLPPGSLVYVGTHSAEPTKLTIHEYNAESFEHVEIAHVQQLTQYRTNETLTWLNVDGVHEAELVDKIGKEFSLHALAMEDILNPNQRPKFEEYDNHLFFVLRMFYFDANGEIVSEQVGIVLGRDYVISFQEAGGDVFDKIRERLRHNKGRVRREGPDYLAYCLIDIIVDHYFQIVESIADQLETLEDELIHNPSEDILERLFRNKQKVTMLRRAIWPLRDAVSQMERSDSTFISPTTRVYLRDVYDHTIQVIETIESYRETLASMLDIYLSSVSQRMNAVMKVLTIIATIFIPLTFIVGIYGMNFDFMPELHWRHGYFAVLAVMALIAVGMLYFFRRRNWL